MPEYEGRLELTWTNKHLRLLAHEDGSYEWVPPSDFRIAEVRLLHDVATIGSTTTDRERASDNLLIRGDALNALTSLIELPEFAREYAGKVKLAYLDPPFNTQQSFLQYDDALEHSVWLTMMRDRLDQIKKLLAPEGSVWLHLDDSEIHRARGVLDEVFGSASFVTTVVWQKRTTRENRPAFSSAHDYIMIYSPIGGTNWKAYRNRLTRQPGGYSNPDDDPKGLWASIPFTAKGMRKNQMYPITTPTGRVYTPPFKNRCWAATEREYERLLAEGRIYFPDGGNGKPRIKQYEFEDEGIVPETWWTAEECGTNDDAKKHIHELFLLGSGTTDAVAQKMGRRWVGIERSEETMKTYVLPRLEKVVQGEDAGGITDAAGWEGGGGFRILDVAPSMFEEAGGHVFLSEWATNGKLAEATAAQLSYAYAPDPPFCGHRGRSRLAVIDGLVSEGVVRILANALGDDESLVVCGTALDPSAQETLRQLRPGSTARKIPQSILQEYRQATRWTGPSVPPRSRETSATDAVRVQLEL